jgi:hypothetical protein
MLESCEELPTSEGYRNEEAEQKNVYDHEQQISVSEPVHSASPLSIPQHAHVAPLGWLA